MKTTNQICRENTRLLGGFDNAQAIAESITNNDVDSFLNAVGALPKEAYRLINLLCEANVPARNQR
jgi:hypothetical protein